MGSIVRLVCKALREGMMGRTDQCGKCIVEDGFSLGKFVC